MSEAHTTGPFPQRVMALVWKALVWKALVWKALSDPLTHPKRNDPDTMKSLAILNVAVATSSWVARLASMPH